MASSFNIAKYLVSMGILEADKKDIHFIKGLFATISICYIYCNGGLFLGR